MRYERESSAPYIDPPVLEQLDDLPASPQANDVTELTKYIGELNNLRSDGPLILWFENWVLCRDQ